MANHAVSEGFHERQSGFGNPDQRLVTCEQLKLRIWNVVATLGKPCPHYWNCQNIHRVAENLRPAIKAF